MGNRISLMRGAPLASHGRDVPVAGAAEVAAPQTGAPQVLAEAAEHVILGAPGGPASGGVGAAGHSEPLHKRGREGGEAPADAATLGQSMPAWAAALMAARTAQTAQASAQASALGSFQASVQAQFEALGSHVGRVEASQAALAAQVTAQGAQVTAQVTAQVRQATAQVTAQVTAQLTARLDTLEATVDAGHVAMGAAQRVRLAKRARLSSAEEVLAIPYLSKRSIMSYLSQEGALELRAASRTCREAVAEHAWDDWE